MQQIEDLQKDIEEQKRLKQSCEEAARKVRETLEILVSVCQKQHLAINPEADVGTDYTDVIEKIKEDVLGSLDKAELAKRKELKNVSYLEAL